MRKGECLFNPKKNPTPQWCVCNFKLRYLLQDLEALLMSPLGVHDFATDLFIQAMHGFFIDNVNINSIHMIPKS